MNVKRLQPCLLLIAIVASGCTSFGSETLEDQIDRNVNNLGSQVETVLSLNRTSDGKYQYEHDWHTLTSGFGDYIGEEFERVRRATRGY